MDLSACFAFKERTINTFRMELLSPGWRLSSTVPTSCWTCRSGRQPAARSELRLATKVRERSERHRQQVAASVVAILRSRCPERDSMQHKSVPLLIKTGDDQSGLSQKPMSASAGRTHRHLADFENGRRAFGDQANRLADRQHIGCKAADLSVASTGAVRLRYGSDRPPVAGVTPGQSAVRLDTPLDKHGSFGLRWKDFSHG